MVVSNFTQKWTLVYFSKHDPWAPRGSFAKFQTNFDTRLNNYGLISSQSMLIYHLKLKSAVSQKRHGCVKFHTKKNFGLLFQKWSLGKVSDQLDTRLIKHYGLISRHTSINCVNNCTFIFTRHQPRLFLKALLVIIIIITTHHDIQCK